MTGTATYNMGLDRLALPLILDSTRMLSCWYLVGLFVSGIRGSRNKVMCIAIPVTLTSGMMADYWQDLLSRKGLSMMFTISRPTRLCCRQLRYSL